MIICVGCEVFHKIRVICMGIIILEFLLDQSELVKGKLIPHNISYPKKLLIFFFFFFGDKLGYHAVLISRCYNVSRLLLLKLLTRKTGTSCISTMGSKVASLSFFNPKNKDRLLLKWPRERMEFRGRNYDDVEPNGWLYKDCKGSA